MGDHLGSIHFIFFRFGRNIFPIRQIWQILLISWSFRKTQVHTTRYVMDLHTLEMERYLNFLRKESFHHLWFDLNIWRGYKYVFCCLVMGVQVSCSFTFPSRNIWAYKWQINDRFQRSGTFQVASILLQAATQLLGCCAENTSWFSIRSLNMSIYYFTLFICLVVIVYIY